MDLSGQRVVILGGTSGIGLATAGALAAIGAAVIIVGRDRARLDRALAQAGQAVVGEIADATDADTLRALFQRTGSFDHLVLSLSGGQGGGPFRTLDLALLRGGFDAKFWGQVTAAQAALPTLRPDGSLTFVTAASARTAVHGTAGLAAINGALEAMVRPLALELQPLRVNAVSPGIIATPWWDRIPAEQREAVHAQAAAILPVKRVGQPEDVAQAILLLIGNGFMTGTVIECDGGQRITT